MRNYIKKISGGKLIKLKIKILNGKVKGINILGDFFFYPEEKIRDVESFLIGKEIEEIKLKLPKYLDLLNVKILGFKVEDLILILEEAFKNEMETHN